MSDSDKGMSLDPRKPENISEGDVVEILDLKSEQHVKGTVKKIVSNSYHPEGIFVKLDNDKKGHTKKIIRKKLEYSSNQRSDQSIETVELLLEHKDINVNIQSKDGGWTALMLACRYSTDTSSIETVKLLLEYKNINVNFLGTVPNSEMPKIYSKYPIYVLCSKYEGNPKTLLEAMACGLLCVATRVGDTELLLEGIGDSCDAGDIEALAESVCRLMDLSTERRKELEADARNRIVEDFSVEKSASLYADLYHSVARTNR